MMKTKKEDLFSVGYAKARAEFVKNNPVPLEEWQRLTKKRNLLFKQYLKISEESDAYFEKLEEFEAIRNANLDELEKKATSFYDGLDVRHLRYI